MLNYYNTSMQSIPDELFDIILVNLYPKDIGALSMTCKHMYRVTHVDPTRLYNACKHVSPHGEVLSIIEDLHIKTTYKDGVKHGKWVSYYPHNIRNADEDIIVRRANYHNGKLHGDVIYYCNNSPWYRCVYINGVLDMMYEYLIMDGTLLASDKYYPHEDHLEFMEQDIENDNPIIPNYIPRRFLTYHKNGHLHTSCYINIKGKNGTDVTWNADGHVVRRCDYVNDQRHGVCEEFINDVCIKFAIYKHNRLDGVYETRYTNNILRQRYTYKCGIPDGVCIDYHKNGNISSRVVYVSGSPTCIKEWYRDGRPRLAPKKYFRDWNSFE